MVFFSTHASNYLLVVPEHSVVAITYFHDEAEGRSETMEKTSHSDLAFDNCMSVFSQRKLRQKQWWDIFLFFERDGTRCHAPPSPFPPTLCAEIIA